METPFLTFRKFNDPAIAEEMAEKLKAHQIPVELEDSENFFDPSFANNYLQRDIRLKLRADDFELADGIMKTFYQQQLDQVGEDYYLFRFSDTELLEIIRNPDEWGFLDYAMAQKMLKDHGIPIPQQELKRFRNEKINVLSKPEPVDKSWTYMGYFIALAAPPIGMIIGFTMGNLKRTLPDGQRLFAYPEEDRKQGKRILRIAAVALAAWGLAWLWFWKK